MKGRTTRSLLWLALLVAVVAACAWVFIPVWTIMPFKAQTTQGLDVSYTLKRWWPPATLIALGLAVLLAVYLWRVARRWWVRAFETNADGRELEFFVKTEADAWRMFDAATGSEWDFTGHATTGALAGRQLKKIALLKDYWFDWKAYNPKTTVYSLGAR